MISPSPSPVEAASGSLLALAFLFPNNLLSDEAKSSSCECPLPGYGNKIQPLRGKIKAVSCKLRKRIPSSTHVQSHPAGCTRFMCRKQRITSQNAILSLRKPIGLRLCETENSGGNWPRRCREGRGERFSRENLLRDHSSHNPRIEEGLAEGKKRHL